ncbi:hypothetical protein BDBG_06409 [Blastomyces gilchristii SLH14081]|uniref:Uncharacterized protein n=1 Tax=Blastomyces gilchristii (strain SLH14081) TaxID=559298 RepID=A0A179UTM3_BLAGS|nr:uncharacterized protein BDBG_06409 [Blastomyces gilchristii SLH14081]OAT10589.1 hypothetical protein BDBG_06409 [Blastomyces gilchristii SLH14081]
MERPVRIYEKQDCLREEPIHFIPALIPRETLNRTLILSRREPQELFLVGEEPPDLELPEGPKLRVLTGRHRLLASQQFLGVVDGSCTMRVSAPVPRPRLED